MIATIHMYKFKKYIQLYLVYIIKGIIYIKNSNNYVFETLKMNTLNL